MSEKKSKMPSLDELGKYVGKLFNDLRQSVKEIVNDYKDSHPSDTEVESKSDGEEAKAEKKETESKEKESEKSPSSKKSTSKASTKKSEA